MCFFLSHSLQSINNQNLLILLLFVLTDRAANVDYAEDDSPARRENGMTRHRTYPARKKRGSLLCNDVDVAL